nr:ParB/RepB/Spo0J family partition protein [Oscillochloris sp. ZM17-4]
MGVPERVSLADLPPNAELIGAAPDEAFVKNVKEFGVMQPILLLKKPNGSYVVSAGRRRVKAARINGQDKIPAVVYPFGWASNDVLTTIENQMRSDNAAADLAAVESLVAQGASETAISEATGKPVATIRNLLRLKGLIPQLRAAFNEGTFKDSVAYKIVALKPDEQRKLLSTLAKNGRLINKDVDILIAATIQPKPTPAPAPALSPTPAPSPAPTAAGDDADVDDREWYEQVIDLVKQIQALAPPSETDIHEIAEDLLKFAEYAGAQAVATP